MKAKVKIEFNVDINLSSDFDELSKEEVKSFIIDYANEHAFDYESVSVGRYVVKLKGKKKREISGSVVLKRNKKIKTTEVFLN